LQFFRLSSGYCGNPDGGGPASRAANTAISDRREVRIGFSTLPGQYTGSRLLRDFQRVQSRLKLLSAGHRCDMEMKNPWFCCSKNIIRGVGSAPPRPCHQDFRPFDFLAVDGHFEVRDTCSRRPALREREMNRVAHSGVAWQHGSQCQWPFLLQSYSGGQPESRLLAQFA
jgi:hypothetical protein